MSQSLPTIGPHPYHHSEQKRVLDVTLAVIGMLVGAPLFLFLAMLLFFTVGRPVLYKQKRIGLRGKIFWMYKFRTMNLNAERQQQKLVSLNIAPGPMFKIPRDPRFVGLGRFLSDSGLDELPQFWNILKGEMSFVGPRPLPLREWEKLPSSWRFRDAVKPGIFSYWTLSPNRHQSLRKWKNLDTQTLNRGSLIHDLYIITLALGVTLRKMFLTR